MHHERKSSVRQAITGSPTTPRAKPGPSRPGLASAAQKPAELGAGACASDGSNTSAVAPAPLKARVFLWEVQGVRQVGTALEPWFVAQDVCAALGIERTDSALRNLDEDEKGAQIVSTLGGPQELSTVNESGLYALIFRSRKPSARLFRKWVTSEVLPAIRKTGGYVRPLAAELPAPGTGSAYQHFIRQDSFRVRDLSEEDFTRLLYEMLYERGEGCTRRLTTLHEIARACIKYHRLWWIVGAADYKPDLVALGCYLARRNGLHSTRTTGPHYVIRSIGRHRHKKWLILRSDNPLWQRALEAPAGDRCLDRVARREGQP